MRLFLLRYSPKVGGHIEHLMGQLETEKAKHSVTSTEALWNMSYQAGIIRFLHKLVEARVHSVIKARGGGEIVKLI